MRRCLAGMLALAAFAPTGCFTAPPDRSISRFEAQLPFTSFAGDDIVQLDVYLVERPAADACLNREVWEFGDEQVLQDRKSVLADNGLRACVLGDTPPDGLQALLRSERSCPHPWRLRFHAGKQEAVVLGPPEPEMRFQLRQDGRTADVDLKQAQTVLQVTTRFTDDGRLALHFTPAIRHGEPEATPRPKQDPSGTLRWEVQTEQPTEMYRGLGWDLTVAPNTYIAVGALPDRDGTLGPAALCSDGPPRTQRLLVLLPGRALPEDMSNRSAGRQVAAAGVAGRAQPGPGRGAVKPRRSYQ